MEIAKVSFTGSTMTGRKIQQAATDSNMKRVTLELGGKSPIIIFDDCDIDKAIFWTVAGITAGTGQVCAATSRLFVQDTIKAEFLARLKQSFEAIPLGQDPQSDDSQYGPIIDKAQYHRVLDYIRAGKKDGATILTGDEQPRENGFYLSPTILLDPPIDSVVYREEVFGPVLCAKTFHTEEEALAMANDTQYGLSGSYFHLCDQECLC